MQFNNTKLVNSKGIVEDLRNSLKQSKGRRAGSMLLTEQTKNNTLIL